MQDELLEIVQAIIDGSEENYSVQVRELFGKKIRSLIEPVFHDKKECENVIYEISASLYSELSTLESTQGFYKWAYRLATVEAYNTFVYTHGRLFHSMARTNLTCKYNLYDEDKELKQYITDKKQQNKSFSKDIMRYMSVKRVILYELYCLEKCSVDEISDLLNVSIDVIRENIAQLREFILDYDEKAQAEYEAKQSQSSQKKRRQEKNSAKKETHINKKDKMISYVFLGIFVIVGLVCGINKIQQAKTTPTVYKTRYQTVYDGVDYSSVYNYNYYRWLYKDVNESFGDDDERALKHFVNYGMEEGRKACENFDPKAYKNINKDIADEYNEDMRSYYIHYINWGRKEGRIGI